MRTSSLQSTGGSDDSRLQEDETPELAWADDTEAFQLHAEHFLRVATAAGELVLQAKRVGKGLALFTENWPHIKSAWDWAIEHAPQEEEARRLCIAFFEKTYPLAVMGSTPEAMKPQLEATERAANTLGDFQAGLAMRALGVIYSRQGRYKDAERLFQRSLEILQNVLDPKHPDILTAHVSLAQVYRDQGLHERVHVAFGQVFALIQTHALDEHSEPVSIASLALYYQDLGRHADAERLFRHAIDLLKESFGSQHPAVATALGNLAISLQERGELLEAECLFRRALSIEESLRPDSPEAAYHLEGIAMNFEKRGLHAEAEPLLRRVLSIRQKALSDRHPYFARTLNNLAVNCRDRGKKHEAEALLRQAVEIYRKTATVEHPEGAAAIHNLALIQKELAPDAAGGVSVAPAEM